MKILVYGINYAPELVGVGKYTSEMCERLAAQNHQVQVVTGYPYYPDWQVHKPYTNNRFSGERRGGVEIIRCPFYVPGNPTGSRRLLSHFTFVCSSALAILWTALRFRPDVVFAVAPSLFVAPAAIVAARLSGARSWLHIQDFEIDSAFELGILSGGWLRRCAEFIERAVLARFDRVSTISPKMMNRLAAKGVSSCQRVEFRNWVDTSLIRPQDRLSLRGELGLPANAVIALYSGTMALKQGIEKVLEAARALQQVRPDIVFVFCGNGPMRNRLAESAGELGNVRLIDLQPPKRLSELLSMADIHLLPQRAEVTDLVLPSKLAPMLASGRPVIAMASQGSQLAVEVGGAGLIIPANDTQSLISALVRLADDPNLRAELGRQGRHLAQTRWEAHTILDHLEASFAEMVKSLPVIGALERELAP